MSNQRTKPTSIRTQWRGIITIAAGYKPKKGKGSYRRERVELHERRDWYLIEAYTAGEHANSRVAGRRTQSK